MVAVSHHIFDLASSHKPSCLQSNNHDGVYPILVDRAYVHIVAQEEGV